MEEKKPLIDILLERTPRLTDEERQKAVQKSQEDMGKIGQGLLDSLTPQERKVLDMRFDLGEENLVTRERIREIEEKALKKLRKKPITDKAIEIAEKVLSKPD